MNEEKGNRCRVHFVCGGVTQCKFAQPVSELECAYLDGKECLSAQAAIEAINEEQKEWTMPQTMDGMELCPECEGRGKLRHNTSSSEGYRLGFIDCVTCSKTGYVKKETDKTEKQNNKLLEALKAVEYSGRYDSIPCCPVCREFEPQHKDDCIVGNAIATAEDEK